MTTNPTPAAGAATPAAAPPAAAPPATPAVAAPSNPPQPAAAPSAAAAAPAAAAPAAAAPDLKLGADIPDEEPKLGVEDAAEPDGETATEGEAEAAPAAPLVYEFTPPEGQTYRQPVIDAYKAALQKHQVDPAAAKDILEAVLPAIQKDADQQLHDHLQATTTEWKQQLQERHGDKLKDVVRLANKALSAGTPELKKFLSDSALAVNPDFLDLLAYFGKRVSNDRSVKGTGQQAVQELSAVDELAAQYDRPAPQQG